MAKPKYNIAPTGTRYGSWTILGYSHAVPRRVSSVYHYWLCQCDCGTTRAVQAAAIAGGKSRSCGERHYMSDSPEYEVWAGIKARCLNPNSTNYSNYGGRGITICQRWVNSFENFYKDIGPRPSPAYCIERKDNNKGYSPDNCIWDTVINQSRNRRSNNLITINGRTLCVMDWAIEAGLNYGTLKRRVRAGWPLEQLLTPVRWKWHGRPK